MYTFPAVSWGGWDSTFSFAKPGELWATFPLGKDIMKQTSGELYIVDTATGKLKDHKETKGGLFGGGPGEPYLVVPSEGDTFLWLLAKKGVKTAAEDLIACKGDKSGSHIAVDGCKPAKELWAMGLPPAICDSTTYVAATIGSDPIVPIYSVSPSGKEMQVTTVNIAAPEYVFGTLACSPASA